MVAGGMVQVETSLPCVLSTKPAMIIYQDCVWKNRTLLVIKPLTVTYLNTKTLFDKNYHVPEITRI